jgi:hypothetical protein
MIPTVPGTFLVVPRGSAEFRSERSGADRKTPKGCAHGPRIWPDGAEVGGPDRAGQEPTGLDRDLPEHSWNVPDKAQPNFSQNGPKPIGRCRSVHMGVHMAGWCRIVRMARAYGRKVPMRVHAFSGA